jgi:hypothetical protein
MLRLAQSSLKQYQHVAGSTDWALMGQGMPCSLKASKKLEDSLNQCFQSQWNALAFYYASPLEPVHRAGPHESIECRSDHPYIENNNRERDNT